MEPESGSHARRMLDKLAESLPEDDPQVQNYVSALRKELASDEAEKEEAGKTLKAYEEAYREKLVQRAANLKAKRTTSGGVA